MTRRWGSTKTNRSRSSTPSRRSVDGPCPRFDYSRQRRRLLVRPGSRGWSPWLINSKSSCNRIRCRTFVSCPAGAGVAARIGQIVILAQLAPSIQEQILFLSTEQAAGISARDMRAIAREPRWDLQRSRFAKLVGGQLFDCCFCGGGSAQAAFTPLDFYAACSSPMEKTRRVPRSLIARRYRSPQHYGTRRNRPAVEITTATGATLG